MGILTTQKLEIIENKINWKNPSEKEKEWIQAYCSIEDQINNLFREITGL